jgi:outer membrane protein assembly factor BamB
MTERHPFLLRVSPWRVVLCLLVAGLLAGCGDDAWLGADEAPPLPGERLSVLEHERHLQPVAGGTGDIRLPPPQPNDSWPQAGGYSHHAMQHMAIGDLPSRLWRADAGAGTAKRARLLGAPIVAEGRVYTIDTEAQVRAFDAETGKRLWNADLVPETEDDDSGVMGGGLAYADGRIFATTGFAEVVALDAANGTEVWRRRVTAPMRAGPTVGGGRVFVVTLDNTSLALAASDGRILWTHAGVEEAAALLGAAEPALDNGVVVVPYTTGEVAALRVDTGAPLWTDSVVAARRTDAAANLTDITARPVIDGNRVFVAGHSGLLVGIDMRTGDRAWSVEAAGVNQPWAAGRYLYVVTTDSQLVAIESQTGRVAWTLQLVQWEDPEDRKGRITWAGPTLASDRLIVTGSNGVLLAVDPYDGTALGRMEIDAGISLAPAIANRTLYFLTDDGDLLAFR